MKSSDVRMSVLVCAVIMAGAVRAYCISPNATVDTLRFRADEYFAGVQKTFDRVAASSAVTGTNIKATERYFVSALKQTQAFYSLVKTNSKGIIISEVIRGKAPERKYRDVANQKWFSYAKENLTDFQTVVRDDDVGRYHLFWTVPLLKDGKRFVGAVVAKIDLWDCFHGFSADFETPFLIRMGNTSLYSHKWEDGALFDELPLTIPGVDRISVRCVKAAAGDTARAPAVAATDSTAAATPVAAPSPQTAAPPTAMAKITALLKNRLVIIALLVALTLLSVGAFWAREKIKLWRTMREIEKEDEI